MVFETHDVLKYLTDMETNLNIGKATTTTTRSPLHELFTTTNKNNNSQEDRLLRHKLCNTDQFYSRQTIESMDPNLIQSTNEFTHLPDHLKMIINKTWKTYYDQENNENYIPNLTKSSAVCTCQANILMNDSIYFPKCSTTTTTSHESSLEINQLMKKIPKTTKLRPRPLLRQKENGEHYMTSSLSNSIVITSKTVTSSNELQSITNTHRPMQVHMRYPIPRKQDAIYNARYKTQPCLHYQKYKHCPLGDNCHFAHGPDELKYPQFHPKYRTRICINYANNGHCPFGSNCYFLHFTPPPNTTITTTNTTAAAVTTENHINHHLNRTATSYWDIDHFIQDDSTIISSSNSIVMWIQCHYVQI
ncbi:unnamed protein product [Schistosoma mattheei]|uniref:C3H1-type domain-containing protein n=1 Tax=Schistosoma mattheei TaxID=31246 RepID=A0AA85BK53_9TREM|nr:unnamed protein product [Schistosoma mattheei]